MLEMIAFDADDTLWHNETLYADVQSRFAQLVAPYASPQQAGETLHQVEMRNLPVYGYGIKGFALSLVEAAVEISQGGVSAREIQDLVNLAKTMLAADIRLMEHVEDTLAGLAGSHPLMMITKGDLFEQERKVDRSGLRRYFKHVEVVSDKTRDNYAALLARHHITPSGFLMVGNSMRSDILPVLEIGGLAVYIPYHLTWAHEHAEMPDAEHERYFELDHLGLLPALIEELSHKSEQAGIAEQE